jgi:penicillin-binding protein 1A
MRQRLTDYFRTLFGPELQAKQRALLAVRGLGVAFLAALLLLAAYALALIPFTPAVDNVLKARNERPSVLLAADGSVLATFRRTNREWIPLDRVPKHVLDALIATEDHRFYQHAGVDWRRSLAAVAYTLRGERQGGSTITQQLARNLFPEEIGRARTATRKVKEMITAIKLERRYSKREVLETYVNTVSFHYARSRSTKAPRWSPCSKGRVPTTPSRTRSGRANAAIWCWPRWSSMAR